MKQEMMQTQEEAVITPLAVKVKKRLETMRCNKAEIAMHYGCSRAMVSQYLNGKYKSNPETVEKILQQFLDDSEEQYGYDGAQNDDPDAIPVQAKHQVAEQQVELPEKPICFESTDYRGVISVCQSCQEDMGLGIIIGKSGFGKTYALKQYAKLPRVAYIECDDTMSCRDLMAALEQQLGLPKATSGTIWARINRIREFLNINSGYLLIIDEADKLINKYTIAKMEILRGIFDQADVGIVIAGEPRLEIDIKTSLARFANRVDFFYKLHGLTKKELEQYLTGWDMTEDAGRELACRAFDARNGCFRLLDRTLNNVLRVLRGRGEAKVTLDIVNEASGMMML